MESAERDGGDEPSGDPPARSVLLLASVRNDSRTEECHKRLALGGRDARTCAINVRQSVRRKVDELTESDEEIPAPVCLIHARDRSDRSVDPREQVPADAPVTVESVTDPADLTSLGVALTGVVEDAALFDERTVVCLDSLTTLLQYVELSEVVKFLNVTNSLVEETDSHVHYHLDPRAHEPMVIATLEQVVEDVVTVTDGGAE